MLTVAHIQHSYTQTPVLIDCNLTVAPAQRLAIIGPSGCGKSTLLRIIAGLEPGHSGTISYDGVDITQQPAHQRRIGLMFQDHALFPHLSVTANIGYGLHGQAKSAIAARVESLLQLVGLPHLAQRFPDQLSGGERQRVALARSLAPSPRLLLLDEPFASLDRSLRDRLLDELPQWLAREEVAAIYVTHDANEACQIASDMLVMRAGQIVRQGPVATLYNDPQSQFVASLLGMPHSVAYTATPHGTATAFGDIAITAPAHVGRLLIPADVGMILDPDVPVAYLHGVVSASFLRAPWQRLRITSVAGDAQFDYDMPQHLAPTIGTAVTLPVRLDRLTFVAGDD
jgi:ABC-type Fe3+/spermidine/putrescine transport system ATPase subunit